MEKSELKDVAEFLSAFVDAAVDNGVGLVKGCWVSGKEHCLLGELIHRSSDRPVVKMHPTDEAAMLLGVTSKEVDEIVFGWDGVRSGLPFVFVRVGRSLRARYERRCSKRKEG